MSDTAGSLLAAVALAVERDALNKRVTQLEQRLELWACAEGGQPEKLPDHLDGIATRNETIKQLDRRIEELQSVIRGKTFVTGEFICTSCGLRKDGEVDDKPEF